MAVAALDLGSVAGLRFFLEFVEADGTQRREPLAAWVTARLEDALPVRSFQWAKESSHFPGSWWSSTTGDHVGFESWLERDHVMVMDFDRAITGIASQPFWLRWQDEDGRSRRHAPDFFARRADGGGVVIDVRPDDRVPAEDARVFRMTAAACAQAGWEFRRAGVIDPVVRANVRWLSRYRHPRCRREPDNFRSSCRHLGISIQPAHPATGSDKPHIEKMFSSLGTLFCQFAVGYLGRSADRRGRKAESRRCGP